MGYDSLLEQVVALLQREQRLSYRGLKLRLQLDDDTLEALKEDLIYAKHVAKDEDGRILVWTGAAAAVTSPGSGATESFEPPDHVVSQQLRVGPPSPAPRPLDAERRQLTVLFCDLVDSTMLASQLDPEDWREVVRAYQETCAQVIARFEGYIAQYLGDGLLVYFGYPQAHEDDAQRAVRAGLGMVEAIDTLNTQLERDQGLRLAVRVGIDTGLVVVGAMGGATRQEQLALGDTPNVAARLQGLAASNTVLMSATTQRLVQGYVTAAELGPQPLKGVTAPVTVYRILGASAAQNRLDVAATTGWTPLVGRESEVVLLRERWAQVKEGLGQVVLLSGEAGIGKSRLVQVLTEQVAAEPQAWLTPCHCSPYYQHTALYPLIELLERVVLRFEREESSPQKLHKLEGFVVQYGLPLAETVPLLATLLSLPLSADYAPLTMSPEQQKHQTLQTLLRILRHIAAQQPVLFVMEDLHWVDPSTLEFLSLLVDQDPTARILAIFTYRPDFCLPWSGRAHLTQVTLNRLPRRQAAEMAVRVAHGKALPPEVVEQVAAKTDGVPLFVEELMKMVLESGLLREREDRYELTGPLPPLAIPATLHDSLMARLDRLAAVKGLAQLGATLGREFAYDLLQAVAPWDEASLHHGLQQLVRAEFLYQRGLPPQATYRFKHVLIQDAAYQSLLKSRRRQYHRRIAQVLAERFPETAETQPELLAHHYTGAGLSAEAVAYWQRAGRRALERSAHREAISHLTTGLELLKTLPVTTERNQQELILQTTLGRALMATKGYTAPDVEQAYARARELCHQVGGVPQRFEVLIGLCTFYQARAEFETARELAEQLLHLAQSVQDPALLLWAHNNLGFLVHLMGELVLARAHLEQSLAFYDPQQHRAYGFVFDPGVDGLLMLAQVLQLLGYPDQALKKGQEALALARQLAHPFSLATALREAASIHRRRGEPQVAQTLQEEGIARCREQGFAQELAQGMILHGRDLVRQGQHEAGMAQMRQGLSAVRATGTVSELPWLLSALAGACADVGQAEEGLTLVAEALAVVHKTGKRLEEAGLYRLEGELLLQADGHLRASGGSSVESEAEACFRRAIDIARRQEAKAFELRAALSLGRLWQRQGKRAEARQLLTDIYGWFTEGFDTADLQEAKALLEELS